MAHIPFGRSFFGSNGHGQPLSGGREIWFGYHQSVRPSQGKMMVNIDVSASAFYKAQPVTDYLCEVLSIRDILEQKTPLCDTWRGVFTREIKDLQIEVTHRGTSRRKYRVCNVTRRPAGIQTFPLRLENGETVECTVKKYFADKYQITLKHPHLQCLQVGREEEHIYFPFELCSIVAGQLCRSKKMTDMQRSTMIKETSCSAPERQREIINLVRQVDFDNDEYMQGFGITISNSMMEANGRVLQPPIVQYAGRGFSQKARPNHGVWDMRGRRLYTGKEISVWAIACFAPERAASSDNLKKFAEQLQKVSDKVGMPIVQPPCFCKYATGAYQVQPLLRYLQKQFAALQLVVVVLSGKTEVYAEVKRVGDTVVGIATQCVQARNVINPYDLMLSNLCLKINVKLGGINSITEPSFRPNEPIIFLGADVTHPPIGNVNKPSIAAVVGSMDSHPSRYAATVRIQKHRQEIIQELSGMARELLLMFFKATGGLKPKRIIFYRDGLPNGQFPHVLKHELAALREACHSLDADYRPGITVIVVQKRHHHTRLFCADKQQARGILGNIPAGTVVDVNITHPTHFDFYLCSHQGNLGTSRPALYHVLWDDNEFTSDEVQRLTYQLCHTYARCTRSISIPAPVYYAHLAAFRARIHLVEIERNSDDGCSKERGERTPEELERAINRSSAIERCYVLCVSIGNHIDYTKKMFATSLLTF
ncbi:hypothetical protein HA402_004583 [Bradysia odoriphaga]|nr:hypothetical protein HA402_004583 [Bradysia odoriphaga]